MPTLIRQNGFDFIIRTHDHEPPHVHVFYQGAELLINIGLDEELPSLREFRGMSVRNAKQALIIAIEHNEYFLQRWVEIYG